MTKEELEKATGQELIDERNYCGVDGYYGDYLDNVNEEMLKRFNRLAELEAQFEREKNLNQCLSDHNEQLRKLIEKMKNCRNCKKEKIEGACGHFTQVGWCKNWELAD